MFQRDSPITKITSILMTKLLLYRKATFSIKELTRACPTELEKVNSCRGWLSASLNFITRYKKCPDEVVLCNLGSANDLAGYFFPG